MNLTKHVLDRYRIHHPEAEEADVLAAIDGGVDVPEALGRTLVGKPWTNEKHNANKSEYVLAPDRRGLFAVVKEDNDKTVVTYLRFQESQERFALKHWPLPLPDRTEPDPSDSTVNVQDEPPTLEPVNPEAVAEARMTPSAKKSRALMDWMIERLVPADPAQQTPISTLRDDYTAWATKNARKVSKLDTWTAALNREYDQIAGRAFLGVALRSEPIRVQNLPTRNEVADFILPGTGVQLRAVRITPEFAESAGGLASARRLLFEGAATSKVGAENLRWHIRAADGTFSDVVLYRLEGMDGLSEWHAGLPDSVPPSAKPWVTEPRPKDSERFLLVHSHASETLWRVVHVGPEGNSTIAKDLGTREEAFDTARAVAKELPIFARYECVHCGGIAGHEYEVTNEVWTQGKARLGYLHIWCLEARLGRDLTLDDLTDDPVNDAILFGFRMAATRSGELATVVASPIVESEFCTCKGKRTVSGNVCGDCKRKVSPPEVVAGPQPQVHAMLREWFQARVLVDKDSREEFALAYEDFEEFCWFKGREAIPIPQFRSQMQGLAELVQERGTARYKIRLKT